MMTRATKVAFAVLGVTLGLGLRCPVAWGWQTNINGPLGLDDEARAASTDANADVIAAGFINRPGTSGGDFVVVKLSGTTGTELWRRVITGTAATPGGEVRALVTDAAGDVVAVGRINNTTSGLDFTVVKLSGATGTELWRHVVDGTASVADQARSVRVDVAGNVIVGGELQNIGTGLDFVVMKLVGTTGAEQWRQVINGTASGTDAAHGVRLDAAGDVFAGGELQNVGTGMDFAVVKLSGATGAEVWRRQIDGSASLNDLARTLRVDSATGNVVAAGEVQNVGTGLDFTVVKLAGGTGAELWRQGLNGTASGTDSAHSVRVDAAGDVIAAGELQNVGTGMDFTVVKLSAATGAEVWRRQINGSASLDDLARAVRVDAAGDVLAAGELQNTGAGFDFMVLKLSGTTGAEIWRRTINGTASGTDRVHALTEDTAANVVAAGFTSNIGAGFDLTVVKLRGTDGSDFVAPTTTTTTTTPGSTTTTTTLPGLHPSRCAATKVAAAGKKAAAGIKCIAKAAGKGVPVASFCLGAAQTKFDAIFAKADAGSDCPTHSDAGPVSSKVDAFRDDIKNALAPGTPRSKCAAKKLKATSKKTAGALKCVSAAAASGRAVSSICLATVSAKFSAAFTAASGPDCITSNDESTIESKVDAFRDDIKHTVAPELP